jgi:hypothetical protein
MFVPSREATNKISIFLEAKSKTLPLTPAMQAGISDHVWTDEELVSLLDDSKRRHYRL